jgi:hypothetical protein
MNLKKKKIHNGLLKGWHCVCDVTKMKNENSKKS